MSRSASDTTAAALSWLGCGPSFRAFARQIAWTAVRACGATRAELEWLSPLVEGQLGERFDELPSIARAAASRAELDHLRARPHDREGAELRVELEAHDAAVEHLSAAYMDTLDWAVGVLRERRAAAPRRFARWRRSEHRVDDAPVPCEVPQRILDGLARRTEEPGWRRRDAA